MELVLPLPSPRDKDLLIFIIHGLKEQGVQRERINIDKSRNEVQIYGGSEAEIAAGKVQVKCLIQDYYLCNKQHGKMNTTYGKTKVDIPWDKVGLVIGKKYCNIQRIKQETGAEICVIKDKIYVGGDDEKRKKAILELENIAFGKKNKRHDQVKSTEGMTKVGIPERFIGLVIGKEHSNLRRIREKTEADIVDNDGAIYVGGSDDQRRKAAIELKTNVYSAIYTNDTQETFTLERFDFVDGTGPECNYTLEPIDCPTTHLLQHDNFYKIDKVDEDEDNKIDNGEIDMKDLESTVTKVLQKIQQTVTTDGSSTFPKSDFWLHFGHVFMAGKVDEAEQGETYSLDDFQKQLNQEKGWKMVFDTAVENMEVEGLKEALAGNEYMGIPPHTRYDISFLTPSCGRIRVKIFLDADNQPTKELIHESIAVRPAHSSSAPYLLCNRLYHRAKINIARPSSSMDVRLNIRTVSTHLTKTKQVLDEETEHEEILKTYLDRIEIQNGEIKLPDDLPDDFWMNYMRKCKRSFYSYDKGEESFTIVISEEQEIDPWNAGKQFDVKTDVQIKSNEINKLLRSEEWEPEQIISRLPTFLSVVKEIQENISASEDFPAEIKGRGPQAELSYHRALKHGKVVVNRGRIMLVGQERAVPAEIKGRGPQAELAYHRALKHGKVVVNRGRIMLVGQERAGKTSLKKSLLGLPFNPGEESTVGVEVDPSCCSIDVDNVKNWQRTTDCTQTDFADNIARLIADDLKHVEEEAKKEDVEEKKEDVEEKKKDLEKKKGDLEEKKEDLEEKKEDLEEKNEHVEDAEKVAEPIIDKEPSEDDTDINEHNIKRTPDTDEPLIDNLNNTKESIPEDVTEKVIHYLQGLSLDDSPTEPQTIVSIWDFAGQHLYYASHPVFLSPRALYLMVYNLSKDLNSEAEPCVRQGAYEILLENADKETNLESILSWLASIHTCSIQPVNDQEEDQENTDSRKIPGYVPYSRPPVIVVGTNADCPFEDAKEMEVLITKSISGKSFQQHLVKPYFTVNNTLSSADQGIQRLQGKINKVLGMEPYMGELIPVRWLTFEKAIKALVEKKKTYHLRLPDLEKIIQEVCFIEERDEIHAMLDYYHDLGVIIKHGDTVVLQAQWLIDLFRKLITVRPYDDKNRYPKFEDCWNDLEDSGILRMDLVEHVFGELVDSGQSKEDLLSMMEHYGLIARFEKGTDARYFVPAQLTSSPEELDTQPSSVGPCALYVHFVDGFVPHGLYSYFISKFIGWYSTSVDGGQHEPNLYRNVSRFIIGKSSDYELILICRKRFIKVVLRSLQESTSCLYQPAVSVRRFIESTLRAISVECKWYRSLRYQFTVLCPSCCQSSKQCAKHRVVGCSNDDCIHLLEVSYQQILVCTKSFGKDSRPEVHNLEVWYATPKPAEGSIPTDKLMCLACDIGEKWKVVGRGLGLSEADLDEIETDEDQLYERCYAVLKRWTEIQGSSANYEALNVTLTHPAAQLSDLALKYCGYLGSAVRPETPDVSSDDNPPEIFLSYQWDIQPTAIELSSLLQEKGFNCWVDIGQMGGGDFLYAQLDKGIRSAKVIISCVTEKYCKSENCQREATLADSVKKPIIPLLLEPIPWPPEGQLGPIFAKLIYIDMTQGHEAKLDELLKKIECYTSK